MFRRISKLSCPGGCAPALIYTPRLTGFSTAAAAGLHHHKLTDNSSEVQLWSPHPTHTHTHPRALSALVYQLLYTSSAESAPAERSVSVCEHWWSSARLSWCRLVTTLNPALVLPETAPLVVGAKPCRGCRLSLPLYVFAFVCAVCVVCSHTVCSRSCFLWDDSSIPSQTQTRIILRRINLFHCELD